MMNGGNSIDGGHHHHVQKRAARKSNPKFNRAAAPSNRHVVSEDSSPSPPLPPRAVDDDDDFLATSEINNMMASAMEEEEEEVPRVVVTQTQVNPSQSQQVEEENLPSSYWNTTNNNNNNNSSNQTNTQLSQQSQQPEMVQNSAIQNLQQQNQQLHQQPQQPLYNGGGQMAMMQQQQQAYVPVDRVNGKGMWRSWTRSFNTPLLALLDLFDNAVDASMKRLPGGGSQQAGVQPAHVSSSSSNGLMMDPMAEINPMAAAAFNNGRRPYQNPKIVVTVDDIGGGGLLIRNSCESPIPAMKQVLEVYKSSKNDAAIGENGIGCKHACANLSTLSILMSKSTSNNSTMISIGIVMEELQKDEGVILPSVFFDANKKNLHHALSIQCSDRPDTWGVAITAYGEGSLDDGLERINSHFNAMMNDGIWRQYDHVFTTLITKLRHRGRSEHHDDEFHHHDDTNNEDTIHYEEADNNQLRSTNLLRELAEELPRLYIHIHSIDVSVQHVPISKLYWEKRLVEITQFDIPINQKIEWKKDPNAFTFDDKRQQQKYPHIRFILGFDPKRAKQRKQASCRVYLYSRESGRLIKEYDDARAMLNLIAGSTDYTQGLTVLVDDYQSTLPLNPTKQDLAFGFNVTGQIHQVNLWAWTSAVASFFWTYHFERLGGKKSTLTTGVFKSMDDLERAFPNNNGQQQLQVPPISAATFTRYKNLDWGHVRTGDKIRVSKRGRDQATANLGRDSVVRLRLPPPPAPPPPPPPPQVPIQAPPFQPQFQPQFQPPFAQRLPWQQQHPRHPSSKSSTYHNASNLSSAVPARGGGSLVTQRVASLSRRVHSMLDEDYVDDNDARRSKRPRGVNPKIEDGVQHHHGNQQQQPGWQLEIDDLKRQLHEKNIIISKLAKDKDEESRQRKKYQEERNELEEKIGTLQFEKEDLAQQLLANTGGAASSSFGAAAENTSNQELEATKKELEKLMLPTKIALEKLKKKYERLNKNHIKLMQQKVAHQQRKNGVAAAQGAPADASPSSTPTTPTQKNGVAIKNELSSPSSTHAATSTPASASAETHATTPGISETDYKRLRMAYNKKKEVIQIMERKINSQKNTIVSLQSENDNLTQQLKQRDEQAESNLFAAGPDDDDLVDDPTSGVTDSDDVADASRIVDAAAVPQINGGDPPIVGNGDEGMNFDNLAFMEL